MSEYDQQRDREVRAHKDMIEAFRPLPENIRTEIKLRAALQHYSVAPHNTHKALYMEQCSMMARYFLLDTEAAP